jgi:hypothetical protein
MLCLQTEQALRQLHWVRTCQPARLEMDGCQLKDGRHHVTARVINLLETFLSPGNRQFREFNHLRCVRPGESLTQHDRQRHLDVTVCVSLPPVQRSRNARRLPHGGLHTGQIVGARCTCGEQQLVTKRQVTFHCLQQQFSKCVFVQRDTPLASAKCNG